MDALDKMIVRSEYLETADDVAALWGMKEAAKARSREVFAIIDEAVRDFLEREGGSVQVGMETKLVLSGKTKTTRKTSNLELVEALLGRVGGDMEAFVECLSSNAILQGAAKGPLGEAWDDHFEVVPDPKITERKLTVINPKYTRR